MFTGKCRFGWLILGMSLLLISCDHGSASDGDPFVSLTYNGTDLSTLPKIDSNRAMMQSFYWDVPAGGWWEHLASLVGDWQKNGIDKVWLPVISKGASGANSMGYDPYDYFDFGEYDQKGATKTRFGSRVALENLIAQIHEHRMKVIVDLVLGHNSGGDIEYHPLRGKNTYTQFRPLSHKFNRTWEDYHPNHIHQKDNEASFFEEQDICHLSSNVQNWCWVYPDSSIAQYYTKTLKVDGWRFDYVKSFSPDVVKSFMASVPQTWAVGEFWDGNTNLVNSWVEGSGISAFDFPNFYTMKLAFNNSDLSYLELQGAYYKRNLQKAITFVSNHDTEKDTEDNKISKFKDFAYAYMLSLPAYPCIFYSDYENAGHKKIIQRLMEIRQTLATGDYRVLHYSKEEFILMRSGNGNNPGMILYMNIGETAKQRTVTTKWKSQEIADYMSKKGSDILKTDADGQVSITAPQKGYSIWSLSNIQ